MQQVHLSEQVFQRAKKAAEERGFESVDAYVAGLIEERDEDNFDHLFTPEVLASLDEAVERMKAGGGKPLEQVMAELEVFQAQWIESHSK